MTPPARPFPPGPPPVRSAPPPELEALYRLAATTPGDIFEHCPTLRSLASDAGVVVELGMRKGVSTAALLAGQPDRLLSVDVRYDPVAETLRARAGRTRFAFLLADSLEWEVPECDLLFVDTLHTEAQLAGELAAHAGRVRRRIALHDTATFGGRGEDGGPGLLPALRRFLAGRPEWKVAYHTNANNGLTVLSRDPADPSADPGFLSGP